MIEEIQHILQTGSGSAYDILQEHLEQREEDSFAWMPHNLTTARNTLAWNGAVTWLSSLRQARLDVITGDESWI